MIDLLLIALMLAQAPAPKTAPVCNTPVARVDELAVETRATMEHRFTGPTAQAISDALAQAAGIVPPQIEEFRVYSFPVNPDMMVVVGLRDGCVIASGRMPRADLARLLPQGT